MWRALARGGGVKDDKLRTGGGEQRKAGEDEESGG